MESCCRVTTWIPTKIYGSERVLFDVPSEAPSFHYLNGYGSEDDTFSFTCSASIREKGSLLLGKVTSQDHFIAMQL
jgi:hypothetical protein